MTTMVDAQLLPLMHGTYQSHHQHYGRCQATTYEDPFAAARQRSTSPPHQGYFRAMAHFLPSDAYDTEGESSDEDMDEDDVEEEEEEENEGSPDDPSQLLAFVGAVTTDIHTLLSRNKEADDYCDVYEERFKSTLSGRELYYADLLALASNGEARSKRRKPAGSLSSSSAGSPLATPAEHTVVFAATGEAAQCTLPHEGRCVAAYGLGPLEELFREAAWRSHAFPDFKGLPCAYQGGGAMPMTLRKLPDSFWEEPGHGVKAVTAAPDFHDLFVHWTA